MKIKAIKRYSDIRLHKVIEPGTVLDVDEARADPLGRRVTRLIFMLRNEGKLENLKRMARALKGNRLGGKDRHEK